MAVFEIEIYFDTICPWCFIGHRVLSKAIELYSRTYPGGSKDEFNFILLPYHLRPDDPVGGESIPWETAVARKNGEERVNAIRTRLQRVGRSVGIEFSFNCRVGITRDSHRSIRYAAPRKKKHLLEAIYSMHFEHDGDITSHADLARAAVCVGMDEDEVLGFLETNELVDEVDRLAVESKKAGVTGVPHVRIGQRRIEGAEDMAEFYNALVAAKEKAMKC